MPAREESNIASPLGRDRRITQYSRSRAEEIGRTPTRFLPNWPTWTLTQGSFPSNVESFLLLNVRLLGRAVPPAGHNSQFPR